MVSILSEYFFTVCINVGKYQFSSFSSPPPPFNFKNNKIFHWRQYSVVCLLKHLLGSYRLQFLQDDLTSFALRNLVQNKSGFLQTQCSRLDGNTGTITKQEVKPAFFNPTCFYLDFQFNTEHSTSHHILFYSKQKTSIITSVTEQKKKHSRLWIIRCVHSYLAHLFICLPCVYM